MSDNDNIIKLTDESGREIGFEFLDLIEYNNEEFVVLLPCEDDEEAGEVVILKFEPGNEDEENFLSVEDDGVLMAVFNIFKEKFKDDFNFVD